MRMRIPHVFTLLFGAIVAASILSWIVPSGRFERVERTAAGLTRQVVVPGSYEVMPKHLSAEGVALTVTPPEGMAAPVGLQGILTAIPRGLEQAADIVFFIFILGAVFGILQRTGVIAAGLNALMERFSNRAGLLVAMVMVLAGAGGSTLGMGEEFIPLVPVFLALSRQLGYDRMFGLAVINLASVVGFAAATTNPFTVAIAQDLAEIPIASGLGLRVALFVVAMTATVAYLLRYGARVKADPSRSLVADLPEVPLPDPSTIPSFSGRHVAILAVGAVIFGGMMWAVQVLGWWMNDMAGAFLAIGLASAAIAGLSADETVEASIHGMKDMVVAALVVGVARGLVVVLEDAQVMDTLIHVAASSLDGLPPWLAAQGMFGFQTVLNLLVPSGSGQAAVTMPLMAPLADLLGIQRQVAVLAFQCGDGMSNMIIPTSGSLMAMLAMADVPYGRWLRFSLPLFGILTAISSAFLAFAVVTGWS